MNLCNECPENEACQACLSMIDGGTLRKKVVPPLPVKLCNVDGTKTYHGKLCAVSRVAMLIQTDAPSAIYDVEIDQKIKARLSPVFQERRTGLIAFDIVEVMRKGTADTRLSKDEYEYLFLQKKDVIRQLTENLGTEIKDYLREELYNALIKSEILDRLNVGSTYKYEKGRLVRLTGEKPAFLKEEEMLAIMQAALEEHAPKREMFFDNASGRYVDVHAIPIEHQVGGFVIFDVTEIVNKEKALLKEQWNNYKEIIGALTHGKIMLIDQQELQDKLKELVKESELIFQKSTTTLRDIREQVKRKLERFGYPEKAHFGALLGVQEAVTNALKHAETGYMQVWADESRMLIVIADQGKGIELQDLPKATLLKGYSTTGSMGAGFLLMSKFSDRVYLKSDQYGTTVALEFCKPTEAERPRRHGED
ncbi:ATP-binding protein [Brevibacillus sp. SYP-B805]|uniref:ATP-binding protein n=1 Tax=Brevibacillus sp. SYP-B805 TaxID=1578199 RepID=UPI0013EA053A|nr:ATP-binding protein [Brevibacillus sp. SYP-B805]NGQ94909.1 ATP-binding protein [Brevibacillus sp. SYP-B805]